ncbi:cytidylate kinase [Desulfotomaculum arcticum]|uniref:Cytidylate kinase n=1 Tax=Desulfotruncus arcticus DSM 17038 TaxID=1121424 RepID=A0A1I2MTG8_9FIRM|nr:(d)CMP kinase [Desulfotruncus arcticus]SFF94772.1 cytidylate kinase [Desulfotomaculum arcticum] [Desulfotruncus arcticus DSM 17038]
MTPSVCIAIDGPAGAGKSTAAKMLASKLGYVYVDTGAMYRAVTYQALMDKINMDDTGALTQIAETIDLALKVDAGGRTRILIAGTDVTQQIRCPEVSNNVSLVSRIPGVRNVLTRLQRELAAQGSVVMEGRDIGTKVLPAADKKFFLTASVEERARRRFLELQQIGYQVKYDEVIQDIILRDEIDSNRALAPLKPAPDAVIVDCSGLTAEQVVDTLLSIVSGG